jgi:5-methylcytosine-specific restriction enzyme A
MADRMYDSVRWRKAGKLYLKEHPLCIMCKQLGRDVRATVVDHVIEHKGDYDLFWNEGNWQSLCATCHSGRKRMQDRHGYSQACGLDGQPLDVRPGWGKEGR